MRIVVVALLALAVPVFAQSTFDLQGYVAARDMNATEDASRLEQTDFSGVAQFGFTWTPSRFFDVHASGLTRRDDTTDSGLVEAYADARAIFGGNELQLRAGQFFLPSSRENKGELWTSPYTINFSALNTWIAQEVRPVGVDLEWRHTFGTGHALTAAATGFRGNDSMGALLGWRGWTIGNKLSTYNDVLPLPPLASFQTFFADQRDDGTQPFGQDLDGNTGVSARVRYSIPQTANVQYLYLDNRADRLLHDGEYAWATDFHLISAEFGSADRSILAAEYMRGSTGMGFAPGFVQADFHAGYVLLSQKAGRTRWTGRYDIFGTDEKDFSPAEGNDERGHSWTVTWMYDFGPSVRFATEFTSVSGDREGVKFDGHSYGIELRYTF
ncbi:MAG TPA: hypothetical protein VKB93_09680 [Thermoanaerobaculia bacterium]|nr:hypothetical protein [Thermoanaerobaculia bacterium]